MCRAFIELFLKNIAKMEMKIKEFIDEPEVLEEFE